MGGCLILGKSKSGFSGFEDEQDDDEDVTNNYSLLDVCWVEQGLLMLP